MTTELPPTTNRIDPFPHVAALSRTATATDNDLIHLTQGTDAFTADLACALFHARIGAHAQGCDVCLPAVEEYAALVLEARATPMTDQEMEVLWQAVVEMESVA